MNTVLGKILSQNGLSPKLAKLARYLENNYQDAAFLGAKFLAEKAGVSEASVTRLAYACGFSGYSQLQAAIKEEIQESLSLKKHEPSKGGQLFSEVISMEREILDEMERQTEQSEFLKAVEAIYGCSRVLVLGTQANVMMAEYMAYFLSPLKKDVILIRELGNHSFNHTRSLPSGAVCIAYCFPRYPRQTLTIAAELRKKDCTIIGISDSNFSPLSRMSDIHFSVPMKYISYVDPCAAVMALSNALMTGLVVRDKSNIKKYIRDYNEFLTGKDLFLEKEIDIIELNSPLVKMDRCKSKSMAEKKA